MKHKQSILTSFTLIAVLGFSLALGPYRVGQVHAEDGTSDHNPALQASTSVGPTGGTQNSEQPTSDDLEQEDQKVLEVEHQEGDLHHDVQDVQDHLQNTNLPDFEDSSLSTYGDVITVLSNLQTVLQNIKTTTATRDQLLGSLTDQERVLLNTLLGKHNDQFTSLDARITELNGQIQDLINILTPLAGQDISEILGLKKLLILEVKGFREAIGQIRDLAGLDFEVVDSETQ